MKIIEPLTAAEIQLRSPPVHRRRMKPLSPTRELRRPRCALYFSPCPLQPSPLSPFSQTLFGAIFTSHFDTVVFLTQIVSGLLLVANRYVPLGRLLSAGYVRSGGMDGRKPDQGQGG